MTTDGGGWILTYIIKNDHGNSAPNWFPYIMKGGNSFPASPTAKASSAWYLGGTPAKRTALWKAIGGAEFRASTYAGSSLKLDFKSSSSKNNGNTFYCAAAGCGGSASKGYSNKIVGKTTSVANAGGYKIGQTYNYYQLGHYACNCWESMHVGDNSKGPMLFGKL